MTDSRSQLAPPPLGNKRALRHGLYATLSPTDSDEVAELADALRDLTPVESEAIEPLVSLVAGQLWRRRQAYRYLARHGITRGRADRSTVNPLWHALDGLERAILDGLKALALTPQAAASVNLTLTRTREASGDFDPARLTIKERTQLEALLEKAETPSA